MDANIPICFVCKRTIARGQYCAACGALVDAVSRFGSEHNCKVEPMQAETIALVALGRLWAGA